MGIYSIPQMTSDKQDTFLLPQGIVYFHRGGLDAFVKSFEIRNDS
jgi:hypothetical protein